MSAKLKELLSQATPSTPTLQYGFVLTIMGILEFRSKFYLIFDVCSDSENDSYVTIITGVLAQRYAIASLHYSRPITTTVLSVMYFYGDR